MRCYSHLSDDEREQIGLAKALGHSIGAIAQAIGRPKSTISRELSRNKLLSGRYSPLHAAGVLADIDTDYGYCVVEIVGHSVPLVFGAPCQLRSLTGQEHGRTIPLSDVEAGVFG